MSDVEVISPGDSKFDQMDKLADDARGPSRPAYDYDVFAQAYNTAEVKSFLVAPEGATQSRGNMSRIIERRNLVEGEDFKVTKPLHTSQGERIPTKQRRVIVQKLSNAEMRLVSSPS